MLSLAPLYTASHLLLLQEQFLLTDTYNERWQIYNSFSRKNEWKKISRKEHGGIDVDKAHLAPEQLLEINQYCWSMPLWDYGDEKPYFSPYQKERMNFRMRKANSYSIKSPPSLIEFLECITYMLVVVQVHFSHFSRQGRRI